LKREKKKEQGRSTDPFQGTLTAFAWRN
jgi:hypothetical protein